VGEYADMEFDRSFHESLDRGETLFNHGPSMRAGGTCLRPGCGGKLVTRTNSSTGQHFLGCSNFPKCRFSA
jgi:hypothetical protein